LHLHSPCPHRPRHSFPTRRSSDLEWQADQFAANLLMPRDLVNQSWLQWRGNTDSIVLTDLGDVRRQILTAEVLRSESADARLPRSEEHTSELQSRENLVCRLLLEK